MDKPTDYIEGYDPIDRFAAAALTGALASPNFIVGLKFAKGERLDQALARQCYELADAMMKEKRKRCG